jgi:hypothetical protein
MIEVLKQALEALNLCTNAGMFPMYLQTNQAAITSLRQAIAELESQEPVAWRAPNWGHSADKYVYRDFDDPVIGVDGKPSPNNEPLYTHPPQRTWVGLTDEETSGFTQHEMSVVKYVNKVLQEKNT